MVRSTLARLGFAFVLAGSLFCASRASAAGQSPFRHLVDIGGGRHLNMVCAGTGSPTVVFMQGLGGDMTNWDQVRKPVAAFTRACFYDRAGLGFSDPSDKSLTAGAAVRDLHAMLRAARIKGRVILVGHSFGGMIATLYADKFLSELAGLVLIDPSFAGQYTYAVGEQDRKLIAADSNQSASLMRDCGGLAEKGLLSKDDSHGCFHAPRDVTPDGAIYIMQQFYRPSYYRASLSEFENFRAKEKGGQFVDGVDGEEEHRAEREFGNLPMVVLTGGQTFSGATTSESGKRAMQDRWNHGHDELARRSKRGESILLPTAHHFIQQEQPEQVVEAIRKVVSAVVK